MNIHDMMNTQSRMTLDMTSGKVKTPCGIMVAYIDGKRVYKNIFTFPDLIGDNKVDVAHCQQICEEIWDTKSVDFHRFIPTVH
jgi:hypothetical protein